MPGVTLHFVLAKRALERLEATGVPAPFDLADPVASNAFYHGALGPDLGYLPGGHRPLSELAHTCKTGQLTKSLIRSARTPTERAFAWGWVTHVLADRLVHPWVGRGVGELLTGSRETFVAGAAEPLSHLRVELGLDCWYAAGQPEARAVRLRPAFDELSIAFLENAYARTYGFSVSREHLLRSHRSVGRRACQVLAAMRILGALMDDAVWSFRLPRVRWMLRTAYRTHVLRGISLAFLNPVSPQEWLRQGVERAMATHTDHFMDAFLAGGASLTDCDLDTGAPLGDADEHGAVLALMET